LLILGIININQFGIGFKEYCTFINNNRDKQWVYEGYYRSSLQTRLKQLNYDKNGGNRTEKSEITRKGLVKIKSPPDNIEVL